MNYPSQAPQERRGASAPPASVHSLVFFGGIILAVGAIAAGALAIWGPENDVEKRRAASVASASAAPPVESALAVASAGAAPAVLPESAPPPEPSAEAPAPKPAGKKRGGRGVRKH